MEVSACQHYGAIACVGLACQAAEAADHCRAVARPGVDWQECDKKLLILRGKDLSGANLFGVDFTLTDLRDTKLSGAGIREGITVASVSGRLQTLRERASAGVEGYRTDFSRTDAEGAMFASAELTARQLWACQADRR